MKPKYVTVEKGILCLPDGSYRARIFFGGQKPKYKRFVRGTSIAAIRTWRQETLEALEESVPAQRREYGDAPIRKRGRPSQCGTLEEDAPRYLAQITQRAGHAADRSNLRAWFAVEIRMTATGKLLRLGALRRDRWTSEHVNLAIGVWSRQPSTHAVRTVRVAAYTRNGRTLPAYERIAPATSGKIVAAKTIRHRCRVLADLFHTLDGTAAPTPVDGAKVPANVTSTLPVGVEDTVIVAVGRQLLAAAAPRKPTRRQQRDFGWKAREKARQRDARQTYARYLVLVTTAQRPCQLMRAKSDDVDLRRRVWTVRTAKGAPAHRIALTDEMIQAWRLFIGADAWGAYDTTKHANRVHRAGWPEDVRPYNARHSVIIDAHNERGVDLDDLQGLAGHTQPNTTRTFYAPISLGRQRMVSDRLEGRLKTLFRGARR